MARAPFTLSFDRLPHTLPIFPLPGAICMPGTQLPLNIFEPRYLNMVFDALAAERMIGMVQPDPARSTGQRVEVYRTGTAGRITQFTETADGRLLIVLSGVCRFDVQEEIPTTRGYRRVVADWNRFRGDYEENPDLGDVDTAYLIGRLQAYFALKQYDTDWNTLQNIAPLALVDILVAQLPFEVPERQSLIEAVTPRERVRTLLQLLDFALAAPANGPAKRH